MRPLAEGWRCWKETEHSDWPIVVQRSDNAGNWPSLDKTAKWSAAAHSGATATLFQSRKSSVYPFQSLHSRVDSRFEITPFFSINGWPMYRRSDTYDNAIASHFWRFLRFDRWFVITGHSDGIFMGYNRRCHATSYEFIYIKSALKR